MRRSIVLVTLACLTACAAADSSRDDQVLDRARQLQLEFRQGKLQTVDPLVQRLELAVLESPDNADLWQALGNAYMSQQGLLYGSKPEPAALIAIGERAQGAYTRAMSLDRDNALLLASHGMAGMLMATLKQDSPALMASIDAMNSAVRRAPKSTPVRLTRGFSIIHLPGDMRDDAAVIEDLNFVMEAAPGGRPEDVLHVLLGDVHAERGELDQARREYELVTGASSFAAEQARLRLDELKKGAVSPASIALVRSGTGYRCVMCHAPGSDN